MTLYRPLILLFFLITLSSSSWALEVPYLSGRINDQVGLIGEESATQIQSTLQQLEQERGAQVAVLIIPELKDDSLEGFSIRVAEEWKLGREGVDDGVLLLVAHEDRKIRIEVGYGLEHVLTDLDSRRIIDNIMVPAFRNGDFEGGIEAAVASIAGKIQGEEGAIPDSTVEGVPVGAGFFLSFFGLFMIPFVGFAVAIKGRGGWVAYIFLAPFFYFVPLMYGQMAALVSLGIYLVVVGILRVIWPKKWKVEPDGDSGSSGGGFFGGSGGSGGGGFSGGGGSFGGGGSSGGW